MGSLHRVPCVHVDQQNVDKVWSIICRSIRCADFVAIDLELSGIGPRVNFSIKDVSERYSAFAAVTQSRSILSIGISTFQFLHRPTIESEPRSEWQHQHQRRPKTPVRRIYTKDSVVDIEGWSDDSGSGDTGHDNGHSENGGHAEEEDPVWPFAVSSFNLLCKTTADSLLEPEAQTFLLHHGFDFQRQQDHGLRYTPSHVLTTGSGGDGDRDQESETKLRQLFDLLVSSRKALVFHNGFMDLLFLYQCLYLPLPAKFGSFVTNVSQLFSAGVYDTKFMTDIVLQYRSSFLEYVYYFLQRNNVKHLMEQKRAYVLVNFSEYPELGMTEGRDIEFRDMKTKIWEEKPADVTICKHYSRHGWCLESDQCDKSHNIDLILDLRRLKQEKSRKKSSKNLAKSINHIISLSKFNEALLITSDTENQEETEGSNTVPSDTTMTAKTSLQTVGQVKSGAHRSGYDAFMTAFAFACLLTDCCPVPPFDDPLSGRTTGLKSFMNCVYLSGKDMPLKIRRGNFDHPSADHVSKFQQIVDQSPDS